MKLRPFKLERYFAKYEFSTRYLLCSSDPESMSLGELLALEANAAARLHALWLGYTETAGAPTLRAAIAALYERTPAERVLVHAGGEEPIFTFMNTALSAGDHVVVQFPAYASLIEIARAIGAEVSPWPAPFDPDDLARLVGARTRAIVINSPHNPTGALLSSTALEAIVAIARRHGLWLLSDEVYRGLEHDPAERAPAACDLYERAVSIGAMAKVYGLAGLRIGWAAVPDAAQFEQMAACKDYLTICNPAPSEFLAELALRHHERLAARARAIVLRNLDLLDGFFARQATRFQWTRPRAGTVAFPALCAGSAEAFCAEVVQRSGVLLLPSTVYDAGDRNFRIGFGRANLPAALAALEQHLQAS